MAPLIHPCSGCAAILQIDIAVRDAISEVHGATLGSERKRFTLQTDSELGTVGRFLYRELAVAVERHAERATRMTDPRAAHRNRLDLAIRVQVHAGDRAHRPARGHAIAHEQHAVSEPAELARVAGSPGQALLAVVPRRKAEPVRLLGPHDVARARAPCN